MQLAFYNSLTARIRDRHLPAAHIHIERHLIISKLPDALEIDQASRYAQLSRGRIKLPHSRFWKTLIYVLGTSLVWAYRLADASKIL